MTHPLAPGEGVYGFVPGGVDGGQLFYTVYTTAGVGQIFRAASDGSGGAIALTDPLASPYLSRFVLSPDQERIAFASPHENGRYQLYTVPTDGSAPPVKLNDPLGPTGQVYPGHFRFTPDNSRVVYQIAFRFHSAPADGSQPPVVLTQDLTVGGLFKLTPQGLVLFGSTVLYAVPADGSDTPNPLGSTIAEWPFEVSPDGEHAVYVSHTDDGHYRIYSVPTDGSSAPVQLFAKVLEGEFPSDPYIRISPDSGWVVHRSAPEETSGGPRVLESAPIDGSAPAQTLNDPYAAGGSLSSAFRFAPDGRVLFGFTPGTGVPLGIYVTPIDHGAPLRLTALTTYPRPQKWEANPQGRVVFTGTTTTGNTSVLELFSVPIDGSALPIRLTPTLVAGGNVYGVGNDDIPSFTFEPSGRELLYRADQDVDEEWELYLVAADGSAPARQMNRRLPAGGDVVSYALTPDGHRVLFGGDQLVNERYEVFTTDLVESITADVQSPVPPGQGIRR